MPAELQSLHCSLLASEAIEVISDELRPWSNRCGLS